MTFSIPLIDTHAHLSGLAERGLDTHGIVKELFAGGFAGILDIGLEPGTLSARIQEFSAYDRVRFASGLWPHADSIANRETLVAGLEQELRGNRQQVCALGEFGLDHNWNIPPSSEATQVPLRHTPPSSEATKVPPQHGEGSSDMEGERELMELQLDLARRLGLPVIIHSRDAPKETAEVLARYPDLRGVIHCFSYGPDEAKKFLDMGYYISFAGNLTYKNAHNIRDACAVVPTDRLLLETDSPYLAPVPHRGKPAHPGMVEEVYKKAAEVRWADIEEMAGQIQENARALFGF